MTTLGLTRSVRRSPARLAGACIAVCVSLLATTAFTDGSASAGPGDGDSTAPTSFVPVTPCRLLDTRDSGRRLPADSAVDVPVVGRCGIAPEAVAVAVTIVAVDATAPGYLAVRPAGDETTITTTVNFRRGDTIANSQLTRLGDDGALAVYAKSSTHAVLDVSGYFVEAPESGVAAGRFVPVTPHRLIDTRDTGRPRAGTRVRVAPAVPRGAIAVAVTIATTESVDRGYLTAMAADDPRPVAAVLNVDGRGQTRAAAAIVPINESGFDVFTVSGDHVIVDITGYFTGDDAEVSTDGLFVATRPTRLADTRLDRGRYGGPRLWDHGTREFAVEPLTRVPVAAVAANVTVTETEDRGHLTAFAAGTTPSRTSTVNYDAARRTIGSLSLSPVSTRGLAVRALEATHVVIDVTGWFTGQPVAATGPTPSNRPPAPRRVTIVSDSAMAGVRWNGALPGLRGFHADTRLESCRRLVQSSCRGREGRRPLTAEREIQSLPAAGPEDMLVMAVGYNDWHERFSSDFDAIVAAARERGFHHIMWVTYRSHVGYTLPGTGGSVSNYGEMNRIVRDKVASGDYPDVRIWDLDGYARVEHSWFASDGVHETRLGSWAVADWLSRKVAAFDDKPCPDPWWWGQPVQDPCPDPNSFSAMFGPPEIARLYNL